MSRKTWLMTGSAACGVLLIAYLVFPDNPTAVTKEQQDRSEVDARPKPAEVSDVRVAEPANPVAKVYETPEPSRTEPKQENGTFDFPSLVEMIDDGEWQEAETLLLKHLDANPKDARALVELAMIQILDKKQPQEAIPLLERAVKAEPDNETILTELMAVYEDNQQIERGLEFLKEYNAQSGKETGVVDYGMGRSLLSLGRPEESIEYLARALEYPGDSVNREAVREDLFDAYIDSGRVYEAITVIEETPQENISEEHRRKNTMKLATAYMDAQEPEVARGIIEAWLESNPEDELALQILSDLETL
ncbi:MAG: tetratricopeptide repeat protein [Pseudobacteriovorax sp.]|nr:tetratricopeptide repeat protein [Pseudobacteriovorax sp.]